MERVESGTQQGLLQSVRQSRSGPMATGASVLVIEASNELEQVCKAALGTMVALTVAEHGRHGVALAATETFDLVILDLPLPDIDGISVLRQLTTQPDQQVLVLAKPSGMQTAVDLLEAGASDCIAKPCAADELLARVRARLRSGRRRAIGQTVEGRLLLDSRRRMAICGGRAVNLSTREAQLLEYLMHREGEVCTREEILESVWEYTFDPGSNLVDVYVARLRQKLDEICIHTVRNVGYSLLST